MLKLSVDKDSTTPLYVQIYDSIKQLIEEGKIKGDKLPSIRSLAKSLNVNNVTIVNAYKLLEQNDYVYSIKGSGTYIKRTLNPEEFSYLEEGDMELMVSGVLPISDNSINFASVSPTPDLFPINEFKQALVQVLDRDGGLAFLYPEVTGYEPLRESISKFLFINYKTRVNKDRILITSGGQQGLDIISKTLINQGDLILVENPTYLGALAAFESRGARVVGIPMMEDGIDVDLLESYVKKHNPKFLYMMTNYQSPTTYSYSQEKKIKVIELANRYNFYIIEDDFLTDLSFNCEMKTPLKSIDKNDKVIFIKSFSKIFMPGIRIAFVTVPNILFRDVIKAKHTTDVSSSGFLQRAFDQYLRTGYWKQHINKVKKVYKERYELITREIDRLKVYGINYLPPKGGLSLWLSLPKHIDAIQLYQQCNEENLALVPGKVFFINDDLNTNHIRLSFGNVSNEEIIKGISILEDIIRKQSSSHTTSKYLPFV
ncbi:MAG TPA: PLP-dependent aminotransferase family protein [Tissierellaceae bacterium]|nr:PLP-dependent aminotransferase family protein [Tissierellaceae bacterium]